MLGESVLRAPVAGSPEYEKAGSVLTYSCCICTDLPLYVEILQLSKIPSNKFLNITNLTPISLDHFSDSSSPEGLISESFLKTYQKKINPVSLSLRSTILLI